MHNETPKELSIGNRVIPGAASGFRFIIWSLIYFGDDPLTHASMMNESKHFKETEFVCELGDVFER
jgi:hypothetical protein